MTQQGGIFLRGPAREKVTIGRDQPKILVVGAKNPSPEAIQEKGKCCHPTSADEEGCKYLTPMNLEYKFQKRNKKESNIKMLG